MSEKKTCYDDCSRKDGADRGQLRLEESDESWAEAEHARGSGKAERP